MHDTFESFIKAFDEIRALLVNKDDMISRYNRVNINALKEIQIFLSVFKKISVEIEGDQYVTRVHILPAMDIINEHIKINPTDSLIVQNMKKRAATYIAENKNEVLPLNHEIWPFFHPDFKRMEGFKSVDKVVVMNTIELAIQSMSNDGTINSVNIDTASNRSSSTCSGNIPVNSIFTSLKDNVESTEGFSDEINRYINCQHGIVSNLLEWWESHKDVYPTLYRYFLQFAAVPATSASAERIFSRAGNLITEKRTRLSPKNVDMLLFLHQNKNI